MAKPAGSAALVLVSEAVPLRAEESLFEAMLEGWCRQHAARRLSPTITRCRVGVVRRFQAFTDAWPWQWRAEHLDAWVAEGSWPHSTVRNYEGSLAVFMDYLCDPRYGWAQACMERMGEIPVQICHEGNTAVHSDEHEGRPGRRPLTRTELQALFDTADTAVHDAAVSAHKGWLAAFRDATLVKVIYAWGLRSKEAAMLDVADLGPNPAAPELAGYGNVHVRFGKAKRGSPPRRRTVATVFPWAKDVLSQYVEEVRPLHGEAAKVPALWLTERGERISTRRIDERFAAWRKTAGLPGEISVHCLRHSYITHLIEDGTDPVFVQHQAGHSWASTTAIYTSVGADHTNTMLRASLDRAFEAEGRR